MAANETTADTLTFCLYNLAAHPAKQAALWEEISAQGPNFTPSLDNLDQLPYLHAVLRCTPSTAHNTQDAITIGNAQLDHVGKPAHAYAQWGHLMGHQSCAGQTFTPLQPVTSAPMAPADDDTDVPKCDRLCNLEHQLCRCGTAGASADLPKHALQKDSLAVPSHLLHFPIQPVMA